MVGPIVAVNVVLGFALDEDGGGSRDCKAWRMVAADVAEKRIIHLVVMEGRG